ncbi:Retrovirus-related Pol polyprotein from transposon RE2 [Vitis vinifera]|uniref:Retrovirus-related Pol polyprotein from transposon RE2 n=1 Tax=Vitis vinifera TaxID=29760 RepID=A0A438JE75_VITVI|nr:Retrovirus-related Pol polyprotein from transposon RE2 [Vitis vinifera]
MVVTVNFTNKGQPSSGGDFSKKSYKPNGSQRNQGQSSARQSNGHQHDGRRSNYGSGKPNNNQKRYTLRCQFCEQMGHTVKHCPKLQSKDFTVNCVTSSNGKDKTWLMDSATPHNIMGDLANLSIHNEYDGTDEVILGDGSGHASALANAICPPARINDFERCSRHRRILLSELTTLMKHGTWDLVPIPLNCNPVGCEWVFRVKRKPDGLVD